MFKVKVKSNIRAQVIAKMRRFVDDSFVESVNREVVSEIKRLVFAGVSPVDSVEGGRRFLGYKNPAKYPGKLKAKRPANLVLTGEMMGYYEARMVNGTRISIGIPTNAPKEVKDRAEANNVGTVNSEGQVAIAARRFVPLKGENFTISVIRKLKKVYTERMKALVSSK